MRDQLIRYVDLLFAGSPNTGDIKQEILQNTLDRYDDLVAQGKTPEAAYSLAISGIGDVSELLSSCAPVFSSVPQQPAAPVQKTVPLWKKAVRAVAVFFYILCPVPLFVLSDLRMESLGLCGTLALVALATALMIIGSGSKSAPAEKEVPQESTPGQELQKAVRTIIFTVGLCTYFAISFATGAWWITWLVFPIIAAVQSLVRACMDLKEAGSHEN